MNSDQSLSGFWLSKSSNGNSKKRINLLLWAPLSTPDWTFFWLDGGPLTAVGCSVQSETNAIVSNRISSSQPSCCSPKPTFISVRYTGEKLRAAINQEENKRENNESWPAWLLCIIFNTTAATVLSACWFNGQKSGKNKSNVPSQGCGMMKELRQQRLAMQPAITSLNEDTFSHTNSWRRLSCFRKKSFFFFPFWNSKVPVVTPWPNKNIVSAEGHKWNIEKINGNIT